MSLRALYIGLLLIAAVALGGRAAPPAVALGRSVTYHAGWNLVGAPDGTRFAGADGPMFTLQAGDDSYEALPPGTPATAGFGYWIYFPLARTVQLEDGAASVSLALPAGRWVLVGNPSGTQSATVRGADAVFAYDPLRGYRPVLSLAPGEGAWAFSAGGGTLTLAAVGAGGQ